jgi:hypothetical protein
MRLAFQNAQNGRGRRCLCFLWPRLLIAGAPFITTRPNIASACLSSSSNPAVLSFLHYDGVVFIFSCSTLLRFYLFMHFPL